MVLTYLDKDGYEISPSEKPVFIRKLTEGRAFVRVVKYVRCPKTTGLIWIGHCEKCECFEGHEKYHGVQCAAK